VIGLVAQRLGVWNPCTTTDDPISDHDDSLDQLRHRPAQLGVPKPHSGEHPLEPQLCECEMVRPRDAAPWFADPAVRTLEDVRRRTRAGMGPSQVAICSYRLAARLVTHRGLDGSPATPAMAHFPASDAAGLAPVVG